MSWTFIPSLIGCMLLMFGVDFTLEDNASTGAVLLALGVAFMALWVWMVRREGRRAVYQFFAPRPPARD